MKAEVRAIKANDIPAWPVWYLASPADELQWFTASIGEPGSLGSDLFQVAVATPSGIKLRRDKKHPFVGLVVDRFDPAVVEQAIRDLVASVQALTWDAVVDQLRATMYWEYEGYSP